MTPKMKKMTCRALVASMLVFSFQTAGAGMIGADQAAGVAQAQADRSMVLAALSRAETTAQLQAMGVDPQLARERVAAMTDHEVQLLAQDMQNAPAGAVSDGVWVALVVIVAFVWYFYYRR